jgi:hypothetical protein
MGQPEEDRQNKTAEIGFQGQGGQDRTASTGLPAQDFWDKTARAGQKMRGQPGKDS